MLAVFDRHNDAYACFREFRKRPGPAGLGSASEGIDIGIVSIY